MANALLEKVNTTKGFYDFCKGIGVEFAGKAEDGCMFNLMDGDPQTLNVIEGTLTAIGIIIGDDTTVKKFFDYIYELKMGADIFMSTQAFFGKGLKSVRIYVHWTDEGEEFTRTIELDLTDGKFPKYKLWQ